MLPLSTRTRRTAEQGLAAGLDEVLALEPSAVLVEAPGPAGPLAPAVARARASGAPVLGVVGPLVEGAATPSGELAASDTEVARAAVGAFRRTIAFMSRLRARRLVVPVGASGLPGADLLEEELRQGVDDPAAAVRAWKEKIGGAREAAIDRLCRAVHAVASTEGAVEVLLAPSDSPAGLLDPETAAWTLEDLPRRRVGLALDTGAAALGGLRGGCGLEPWFEALDSSLRLLLLSDHDGRERADLLPGAGRLDPGVLRPAAARSRPWVLRCDPTRGLDDLRECEALLLDRLGGAPDPEAWV